MEQEVKYEYIKPAKPEHFEKERDGKLFRVHPPGHSPETVELYKMAVVVDCPFCNTPVRAVTWQFHKGDIYCPKCNAQHHLYRSSIPARVLTKKQRIFQKLAAI